MPVRIGLILYVNTVIPAHLADVIDSIRTQSQVPYFTRIVMGHGVDMRFDVAVDRAIANLKQFCPNVVTMMATQMDKSDAITMANNSLHDKPYDVLVLMDDDVVLPQDTLFHLTNPYLWVPNLLTVDGVVHDARHKVSAVKKFLVRAMGRELITGKFSRARVGVLSAARKINVEANLGQLSLPLWSDIHRYPTAEPKLDLYY